VGLFQSGGNSESDSLSSPAPAAGGFNDEDGLGSREGDSSMIVGGERMRDSCLDRLG